MKSNNHLLATLLIVLSGASCRGVNSTHDAGLMERLRRPITQTGLFQDSVLVPAEWDNIELNASFDSLSLTDGNFFLTGKITDPLTVGNGAVSGAAVVIGVPQANRNGLYLTHRIATHSDSAGHFLIQGDISTNHVLVIGSFTYFVLIYDIGRLVKGVE